MSRLLEIFEPEETVGGLWHRLVGDIDSYPRHPEAAVALDEVRGRVAVFFRGLGGDAGVEVADAVARTSGHRLNWRQRLGRDSEALSIAQYDHDTLRLPPVIDLFPEADLNADLFLWLAAYFAASPAAFEDPPADLLQADLARLRTAHRTVAETLRRFPGLAARYARLRDAFLSVRPRRSLPRQEAAVEALVLALLKGEPPSGPAAALWTDAAVAARRRYRPMLAVPLWGRFAAPPEARRQDRSDAADGGGSDALDKRTRSGRRRSLDQTERDDPLILNRFEKILTWADMLNINRQVDDEDADAAKKAADDMDEITVTQHRRAASTKLKFDLDLPPNLVDLKQLLGDSLYPEWDYRRRQYHRNHCRVFSYVTSGDGANWSPDGAARRRVSRVRRQFEALRPRRVVLRAQPDGAELDIDSLVRSRCDLAGAGTLSNAIYLDAREQARDLAVAILVDTSLSTDSWIENRRVLDVEKEALNILAHGLDACGDDFALYGFTSRKRNMVLINTIKAFDEPFGEDTTRRISALKPGYYTRIGAAIRHVAGALRDQPHKHRLLLVLTDGKPNDVDHYDGRYGVEDTRKAIQEARRTGLSVFGVTVDREAQSYFPYVFGRGGFAIVGHVGRLSSALPAIYRQVIR